MYYCSYSSSSNNNYSCTELLWSPYFSACPQESQPRKMCTAEWYSVLIMCYCSYSSTSSNNDDSNNN